MNVSELLPWLNLLLFPAIYGILHVAGTLKEINVEIREHNRLDDVRFEAVIKRLEQLERTRQHHFRQ